MYGYSWEFGYEMPHRKPCLILTIGSTHNKATAFLSIPYLLYILGGWWAMRWSVY